MIIKKLIHNIHLWFGLSSGLVVFLLGLTGCLLVFEYDLKEIIYKSRYTIQATQQQRLPITQLLTTAQNALGSNHPINGIYIPTQKNKTVFFVALRENDKGWNDFDVIDYFYTVYLNPYTAEVVKIENTKLEFFRLAVGLHYDLWLNKAGKKIIGWSTVIFILLLFSGLVLWWPKNKPAAKQRIWFRWKSTTRWKRKNYDLHNISGFYALLFSLVIALTGLVWAFRAFDNGLQWLANGGKSIVEKEYFSDTTHPQQQVAIYDKILSDMQNRSANDLYYIGIPEIKNGVIFAYSQNDTRAYQWTNYSYDQYSGENLATEYYEDRPTGEKLRNMNYYIHTGAIAGLPGKILAFIISFICTALPITGFYIWWGRKKKKA